MQLGLSLASAVRSLRVHPLRSLLTILGVVVGVAAVVAVIAVGEGARARLIAQIQSLGGNLLLVTPGSQRSQGAHLGSGSRGSLTQEDARAILHEIPGVLLAASSVFRRTQVVRGNLNWSTTVQGITNDYLGAREWPLREGRPFSSTEQAGAAKVAILGSTVATRLFPHQTPVGALIRVGDTPFQVIGVLEPKGQSSGGADQDDKVMMPLSTARIRVLGSNSAKLGSVQYVMAKVDRAERLAETAEEIRRLLRQRHGLGPSAPDDFTVRNLAEVQASRQAASGVLTFWLTAVASVSLLVGGISIMNVMLVSVSERTREIGLRMAVGARGGEILQQFMVEALLLSSIGGAAGLALGILASLTAAAWADIPILVSPIALFLALGAAVATGVASGVFPALKASRLSPVVALADARETQFHAPASPPAAKPG